MLFHASQVKDIKVLEPRFSNYSIPLIYFSKKRENVLVYLSNAIQKYCNEKGFDWDEKWSKWGPFGFKPKGMIELQEYYPNALEDTYKGVSAYIYSVNEKGLAFSLGLIIGEIRLFFSIQFDTI